MEFKSGDVFFYKKFLLDLKKSESWLEKIKWRRRKREEK